MKSGKHYNTRSVLAHGYRGGREKEEDTYSVLAKKEMKKIRQKNNNRQNRTGRSIGRLTDRHSW